MISDLLGGNHSQDIVPHILRNPDSERGALETPNRAGWQMISLQQPGYDGKTDSHGSILRRKTRLSHGSGQSYEAR